MLFDRGCMLNGQSAPWRQAFGNYIEEPTASIASDMSKAIFFKISNSFWRKAEGFSCHGHKKGLLKTHIGPGGSMVEKSLSI